MCSSLASPPLSVCLFLFLLLRVTFITSTGTDQTDPDPGLTFDSWLTRFQVVQLDGSPVYPPCGRIILTPPPPPTPTVKPSTTTKPYRVVDIDGSPVNHYPPCRVIPVERQHPDQHPDQHLTTRPPPSQETVKAKTTTRTTAPTTTTTVNRKDNDKQPLFAKKVGHPLNRRYPKLNFPLHLANSRPALSSYNLLSCFRLPAHWLLPGHRLLSKPIGRLPRKHSGTDGKRNRDLVSLLKRSNRQSVLLSVLRRGQTDRQNIVGSSSEERDYRNRMNRTGLEPLTLVI
ncbi:uncharacterized protein [Salmo salar]|uniref:Extensin-like n=1 Tax=Salmo salar TaxID=8030 RepID=A0A1S3SBW4_SALSA|nr:uncharacterized protein LOC106608428 [Salmo salar]|eukprot:XP_014061836.1 PREDICTED: uncharacterized protein LOC106608428 [Salmo salar]